MKTFSSAILIFLMFTASAFASVNVSQPASGTTVGSPVQYKATATSNCSKGIASMGVYLNSKLKYVATGSSLNTSISLSPGTYHSTVEEWDNCGGATTSSGMIKVASQTGVYVSTPANNSTVTPSVSYAATATSGSCPQGVAAMGIYVDSVKKYTVNGAKLNTKLNLSSGTHQTTVKEWDHCGGAAAANVTVKVNGNSGTLISNIQAVHDWIQWGELPPDYAICNSCSGVKLSMAQHVKSPSKSGNATKFVISGTKPYSDALWDIKLIGQGTALNLPDTGHKLIPNMHNFTYDADIDFTQASVTQALEIDIDQYLDGVGMIWGAECDHLNTGHWKLWDNTGSKWVDIGIACPLTTGWHHVTFQVQRESNNDLLYQSITWDGVTHNINKTYAPFKVPSSWYGLTVKYQIDGDSKMHTNTTYLDDFNLRYW